MDTPPALKTVNSVTTCFRGLLDLSTPAACRLRHDLVFVRRIVDVTTREFMEGVLAAASVLATAGIALTVKAKTDNKWAPVTPHGKWYEAVKVFSIYDVERKKRVSWTVETNTLSDTVTWRVCVTGDAEFHLDDVPDMTTLMSTAISRTLALVRGGNTDEVYEAAAADDALYLSLFTDALVAQRALDVSNDIPEWLKPQSE